jgi:hypothetical protein
MRNAFEKKREKIEKARQKHLDAVMWCAGAMGRLEEDVIRVTLNADRKKNHDAARSRRTGRLWRLGLLVEHVGLLDFDALLGALRSAAAFDRDTAWQEKWRDEGRRVRASNRPQREVTSENPSGYGPDIAAAAKQRKAHDRRRIAAGGLVEKAGLAGWDREVLLGLLASIARHRDRPERVQRWKDAAAETVADPADERVSRSKGRRGRTGLVEVQFPKPIPKATASELRALGIKFDRWMLVWRGFADAPMARKYAKTAGGRVVVSPRSGGNPRKNQGRKNQRSLSSG